MLNELPPPLPPQMLNLPLDPVKTTSAPAGTGLDGVNLETSSFRNRRRRLEGLVNFCAAVILLFYGLTMNNWYGRHGFDDFPLFNAALIIVGGAMLLVSAYCWGVMTGLPEVAFTALPESAPISDSKRLHLKKILLRECVATIAPFSIVTVFLLKGTYFSVDARSAFEVGVAVAWVIVAISGTVSWAYLRVLPMTPEEELKRGKAWKYRKIAFTIIGVGGMFLIFKLLSVATQEFPSDEPTSHVQASDVSVEHEAQTLFNRAAGYGLENKHPEEIADYTRLIEMKDVPVKWTAMSLFNRGLAYGKQGRLAEEIADYTRLLGMKGAPSDQVAKALFVRGLAYGKQGMFAEEIADYTRLIEMKDAPAKYVASALVSRGVTSQDKPPNAIADYTRVIEMKDAPAKQVAYALFDRGLAYGKQGRSAEEIADYTRLIEMKDAPIDQVAKALYNRGVIFSEQGKHTNAYADYTRLIAINGAPNEQLIRALHNRGRTSDLQGDPTNAIVDYTRVIEMKDASAEQVAQSLFYRGCAYARQGKSNNAIADFTRVIEMKEAEAEERTSAAKYLRELRK